MTLYEELMNLGQYYMAGYLSSPKKDRMISIANSIKCHFENMAMPETNEKETLYPNASTSLFITGELFWYFYCYCLFKSEYWGMMSIEKIQEIKDKVSPENKEEFNKLYEEMFPYFNGDTIDSQYHVGGGSYVHSIINYERILNEGLDSYLERIEKNSSKNPDYYSALKITWEGIKILHTRTIEFLKSQKNPDEKLIKAFETVPFKPATNLYEAIVCVNFMYYIDGADSLGRFDQYMMPFLKDTPDEEAVELIRAFFHNMDRTSGWQVTLGGSNGKNKVTNKMTELCLIASKGLRRPNLTIKMNDDEDEKIWDLVLDGWASGNGNPAIYNDKQYCDFVGKYYNLKEEDISKIAYGGCTETMVSGLSNVGSIECGLCILRDLDGFINSSLTQFDNYEDFYDRFVFGLKENIKRAIRVCNIDQELKAKYNPLPIRSLLIDDCIDSGVEYQAGGARYNGSCFNFAGVTNVVNSLYSLKTLGFGKKYTNEEIVDALKNNFTTNIELLNDIKKLPKFGNNVKEVDQIAGELMNELGDFVLGFKTWRKGGNYIPSHIIFTTYVDLGRPIGATPDGRGNREPISDSLGAYQGTDREGPTSLINSILNIPLDKFCGTPVINMRFSKSSVSEPKEREKVKALLKTYLKEGGMQLQATVIDQAAMKDALKHPENYNNLIVRIGGYSEYFNNLSNELKLQVLKRYEHFK